MSPVLVMGWRHSGFNVFCGSRIQPGDADDMENLARYIIRASFSQERLTYIPEESKVVYKSMKLDALKIFSFSSGVIRFVGVDYLN
jgi:hypothetical protein